MASSPIPEERNPLHAQGAQEEGRDPVIVEGGTGVFCRPGCPQLSGHDCSQAAFRSPREALGYGYLPCAECRPTDPFSRGKATGGARPGFLFPDDGTDAAERAALETLVDDIAGNPFYRAERADLKGLGLDADRLDGIYLDAFGIDFQDYLAFRRLNHRFGPALFDPGGTGEDSVGDSQALGGESKAASVSEAPIPPPVVCRMATPLGPILVAATPSGIAMVDFADGRRTEKLLGTLEKRLGAEALPGNSPFFPALHRELRAYFRGEPTTFSVPVDLVGTDFQTAVWRQLREIGWGETRTYAEQAGAMGRPGAVRAAARADGENPVAILVPCHRIVGSDGSLTGYRGGLRRKEFLLRLESGRGNPS